MHLTLFTLLVTVLITAIAQPPACPVVPENFTLHGKPDRYLPDPFTRIDGTRITNLSDWTCRKHELSQLFQMYEYGNIPGPPESTSAFMNGTKLVIEISHQGPNISFSANITLPSSESPGPYPALISLTKTIPISAGIAEIYFSTDEIATLSGSGGGRGKFFTLYGRSDIGNAAAWAWSISRLIDALELTPQSRIDPRRLALSGCSRYARAVLAIGAFEERIALTIPQEGGVGGDACWRVTKSIKSSGIGIGQPEPDDPLLKASFDAQFRPNPDPLPFDQHEVAGLIAPRGLLVLGNDIDWLKPSAVAVCMTAAHRIYRALGVPGNMALLIPNSHSHCSFPEASKTLLYSYYDRFLFGNGTAITETFDVTPKIIPRPNADQWVRWDIPDLG
jgi:hypothetical protein